MSRILVAAGAETLHMIKPAIETHATLLPAPEIEQALRAVRMRIDAVVCDACFDDCRMFALLHALRARQPRRAPPVICCTRRAPSGAAREAIEAAARSFGACTFIDLGLLTQRYDRALAGEVLARIIRREIEARGQAPRAPH